MLKWGLASAEDRSCTSKFSQSTPKQFDSHQGHKLAEENQSVSAAREPTNKINISVSYYATRSSPLVASRLLNPLILPSPPPPALCFRDIMIASLRSKQSSLRCRTVWQCEPVWHQFPLGSPSQAFRVEPSLSTHVPHSFRRRSVPVRRSHGKIRWPPIFHSHSHEMLLSHQLLKNCIQNRQSRGE